MTDRSDLDAAQARADALARQVEQLERDNAELRRGHEPVPRPPRPKRAPRRLVIVLPVVLSLAGAAVGISVGVRSCTAHVEGTISASGGKLGTWTVHPDTCRSGQRNQFRGVQFFEDGHGDEHGVGFHQPMGEAAAISVNQESSDHSSRFTASECNVLDGHIEQQNSSINRITNLRGYVKFDCTWQDEHVSGDLKFENCH